MVCQRHQVGQDVMKTGPGGTAHGVKSESLEAEAAIVSLLSLNVLRPDVKLKRGENVSDRNVASRTGS